MVYHREKFPEKQVEIDVVDTVDHDTMNQVTAVVTHSNLGEVRVSYGFPKGQGWQEELNGKKKFLLKLKEIGLKELGADRVETEDVEKNAMDEMLMSEKQKV